MNRKSTISFACAAVLTAFVHAAQAGEDEISTDRPDFVESSLTVGKNRFQVETSFAFERARDDAGKEYTRSTPTLFRYGVSDNLELRLETDGALRSSVTDYGAGTTERRHGWADASVGVKWHTQDGEGAKPSVAWLFHADLDSGSAAFRGHGVRPSARVAAEWELANEWSLGVMSGLVFDKDDTGRFTAGILAAVLGKELREGLRVFGEVSGRQLASNRHGGSVVTYDTGIAYLLAKNMQIDAALAFGANDHAPDVAATVGFSVKF